MYWFNTLVLSIDGEQFYDHRSRGSGDIRADGQTDLRIYYIDCEGNIEF